MFNVMLKRCWKRWCLSWCSIVSIYEPRFSAPINHVLVRPVLFAHLCFWGDCGSIPCSPNTSQALSGVTTVPILLVLAPKALYCFSKLMWDQIQWCTMWGWGCNSLSFVQPVSSSAAAEIIRATAGVNLPMGLPWAIGRPGRRELRWTHPNTCCTYLATSLLLSLGLVYGDCCCYLSILLV